MKRSLLFLLGLGLAFSRMPTMLVNKYLVTFLFLLSLLLPGCENQRRGDGDDDDSSTSDDDDSSTTDDDDFSNDDDSSPNDDDDISPEPETIDLVASEDAVIRRLGSSGDSTNYGYERYNNAQAWTNASNAVVQQSLINFDLSSIPAGAEIVAATLRLYSDPNSPQYPDGHDQTSGSNECIITRVVSPWSEASVTWDNQPERTENNATTIPASSFAFEDKVIDVGSLVQDMLNDSQPSFGFHIQLAVEIPYRRMVFASVDHQASQLRPQLTVDYLQ
jgi:hypothetical protein